MRLWHFIGGILVAAVISAPAASAAPMGSISELATGGLTPGFSANSEPNDIVEGADGNLWVAEGTGNRIARVTPAGAVTEFSSGISPSSVPNWITAGPDGNVWFTEQSGNRIGRITPAGAITEFSTGITGTSLQQIISGPDGKLWFLERGNPTKLARLDPATAHVDEFPLPTAGGAGTGIAVGPDANLWITEAANPGKIARAVIAQLVPGMSAGISEVATGGVTPGFTANTFPFGIAAGADGNMWVTESLGSKVLRITTGSTTTATEFPVPAPTGILNVIVPGPDGNLWLADQGNPSARIAELNPLTGFINTFSAGLTGSGVPDGLATAPDGNIWFAEFGDPGRVGRIGTGQAAASLAAPDVLGSAQPTEQQRCGGDRWATWAGEQPLQTGVQWLLDGTDIAGATNPTFTPVAADVGHRLSCRITVSYTMLGVTVSAASSSVTVSAAAQGPPGRPGAPGKQGPPGPPGKIELVVCQVRTKLVHHKRRNVRTCTTKLVSKPIKFTAAVARVKLTRAGRTYATGTARFVHGTLRLELRARHRVRHGRYRLTLTFAGAPSLTMTITMP